MLRCRCFSKPTDERSRPEHRRAKAATRRTKQRAGTCCSREKASEVHNSRWQYSAASLGLGS